MLIVPDGDAALDWYKHALGAEELWNLGGVAGFQIDGAPCFCMRSIQTIPPRPILAGRG